MRMIDEDYERALVEDQLREVGYCEASRRWLLDLWSRPRGCMAHNLSEWFSECARCAYNSHKVPVQSTVSKYLKRGVMLSGA